MKKILFVCLAALFVASCAPKFNLPASKRAIVEEEFVCNERLTRDCHASSLIELENGDLLCTWFGGTRESHPDVQIWVSRKPLGGVWSTPEPVAKAEEELGGSVFNPVIVQCGGDTLQLFYLSPDINDGRVITSNDGGHTWSKSVALDKEFTGPLVNKPIYLEDGTILSGGSMEGGPGWRIHVERSTDKGKSWTRTPVLNDPKQFKLIQPTFLVHSQEKIQLLARSGGEDAETKIAQAWSEDGGKTWSEVTNTTLPNNNSAIDAVSLPDGRHLLVYNHSTRNDDSCGRKGRGILTVAETKDGVNWNAAAVLEFRTGAVQYSYPAMIRTRDGLVHITYSWHRKFIKHVVLDPAKLVTAPIVDGQWPKEELPWVMSADSMQVNIGRDTEVLK
ncbi:MAG: exo-alpha-sialidase [Alistipes sp.]|nr:exo-alpha-sialidase [Alistipes sp.]